MQHCPAAAHSDSGDCFVAAGPGKKDVSVFDSFAAAQRFQNKVITAGFTVCFHLAHHIPDCGVHPVEAEK